MILRYRHFFIVTTDSALETGWIREGGGFTGSTQICVNPEERGYNLDFITEEIDNAIKDGATPLPLDALLKRAD